MVLFALVLAVSVTVGWLTGGRLRNLLGLEITSAWLVFIAFGLQLGLNVVPVGRFPAGVTSLVLGGSMVVIGLFLAKNPQLPGLWLIAAGFAGNALVIAVNGGMPVAPEALSAVGGADVRIEAGTHQMMTSEHRLSMLADIVPVPVLGIVISIGDVVLVAGLGLLVAGQMRRFPPDTERRVRRKPAPVWRRIPQNTNAWVPFKWAPPAMQAPSLRPDRFSLRRPGVSKDDTQQSADSQRSNQSEQWRSDEGRSDHRRSGRGRSDQSPGREPARPWRTEGVPQTDEDGQRPRRRFNWVLAVIVGYLVIFGLLSLQDGVGAPPTVAYSEFLDQVEEGNVAEIFARDQSIEGLLSEPRPVPEEEETYQEFITERPAFAQEDLLAQLEESDATVRATPVVDERGPLTNLLVAFGPLILIVLFYVWLFRRMRGAQGMGMAGGMLGGQKKEPVSPEEVRVSFEDVAGIDEVEREISEVVDFLRQPEKYQRLGAKAPKGVLLGGQPGTGKTLLARATAGEAGVPFFSASGSEFIEMVVGVGARRVRELFEEAQKVAPAIIFIDEIDTIGRARGGPHSVGGHDEREQTLNQILTEMDGFSGSEGVVVLAATNRPDVLDPALLRPGRFDRTIMVHPPDQQGRVDILKVHTRGIPLGEDTDLEQLAKITPGMTGAALANLVNEAALLTARNGREQVTQRDLAEALEKVQLGAARDVVIPEEERRRTAYHEAGHALLGMLQPGADPVRTISIIPRGRALGVTVSTPDADRYGYDERYLRGRIIGALGGMAAEDLIYNVVTTGAESDLETSTRIARAMVGRWGMSEGVGPISVLPQEGDPRMAGASEGMLEAVDNEVRRIVSECYVQARETLSEHRDRLERIVAELLEHETLDEAQAYAAAGVTRNVTPEPSDETPAAASDVTQEVNLDALKDLRR